MVHGALQARARVCVCVHMYVYVYVCPGNRVVYLGECCDAHNREKRQINNDRCIGGEAAMVVDSQGRLHVTGGDNFRNRYAIYNVNSKEWTEGPQMNQVITDYY